MLGFRGFRPFGFSGLGALRFLGFRVSGFKGFRWCKVLGFRALEFQAKGHYGVVVCGFWFFIVLRHTVVFWFSGLEGLGAEGISASGSGFLKDTYMGFVLR